MTRQPIKINKKVDPRHAGITMLESPVLPEDEARNREFAEAEPLLFRPGANSVDPVPLGTWTDGPSETGAGAVDSPRLAYDIEGLPEGVNGTISGQKLKYGVSALPGRQRFHITNGGDEVIPATGAQAPGYYGVSKKGGSDIGGLSTRMIPVIGEMAAGAEDLRLPRPVITAGSDGQHGRNSLHYKKLGIDFRGNDISDAQGRDLARLVQTRMGQDYDILFEQPRNKPPAWDHFHTEYDPPKRRR